MDNSQEHFTAFMNLHDVFLNASLCRSNMMRLPVEKGGVEFTISDRGRFERMWVTFIYILIEAWRSSTGKLAKSYMAAKTSLKVVGELISRGEKDGSVQKMKNVRHYMCHRDKREYWDLGRIDVAGQLTYHDCLHNAFSDVFLQVLRQSKEI
jgi:hypothetical protein